MLMSRIVPRIRRDFFRWNYLQVARRIRETPPLHQGSMPFTLLSMVHHRDILSYLVAVKSFTRFANPTRVIIVCDPSIDDSDRATLKKHIPHVELRAADEFTHVRIPRGGTWERLFAISGFVTDSYVVQLDADTVTTGPIAEVTTAIHNETGFVLGECPQQQLLTLPETAANARPKLAFNSHIQTLSESIMDDVGLRENSLYVRGCSGFTGFPRSQHMREELIDFSDRMQQKVADRWTNWGTEQITSNYLVANASSTTVLPFPKYGTPDAEVAETAFIHFIGSMRFINSKYEKTSKRMIHALNRDGHK